VRLPGTHGSAQKEKNFKSARRRIEGKKKSPGKKNTITFLLGRGSGKGHTRLGAQTEIPKCTRNAKRGSPGRWWGCKKGGWSF